jgi:hypothetical protein
LYQAFFKTKATFFPILICLYVLLFSVFSCFSHITKIFVFLLLSAQTFFATTQVLVPVISAFTPPPAAILTQATLIPLPSNQKILLII